MADLPPPLVDEVRGTLRDLRSARLAATTWPAVAGHLGRLAAAVDRDDHEGVQRALLPVAQVAFEGKVRGRLASADRRAAVVTATKPTSSLPVVGAVCGALICLIGFALGGGLVLAATAAFGLFIFGVALAGTRTNAERTEDRIARRASPTRVALEPAPSAVLAAAAQVEHALGGRS